MQCPNCGTDNRDGAKFCDECGFPIGGDAARAAFTPAKAGMGGQGKDAPEGDDAPDADENAPDVGERPARAGRPDTSAPDLTAVLDSLEDDSSGHGAAGETQVIEQGAQSSDVTRAFDEDDFAGFSKTPDDGFSFDSPLSSHDAGFTMKMPRVEGEQPEQSHDFMASSTVPKKSHAKAIGIAVAVVVVALAAVAAAYFMGLWGGKVIPDVAGMTETDARAILEESGFTVRATQVKSDDTEGLVLIMDPAAGTRAPESSEVVIHVASARLVPDIVGKTSAEAAALLAEAGYDNVTFEKVRHDGDEDVVLSVEPAAGERAKSYSEVKVSVSEPFKVPDISGMSWDEAIAAIEEAGLEYQVVYVNTEYYAEGSIINTTPEAGAVVSEGAYVSINIAQSRATVLTSLTQNLLVPGSTVNVNGYDFTIDALNSVSYLGNDTVAFSFTGRPYVSLLGEVIHASSQTVNGQVVWSPSNEVVSIS